MEHLPAAYKQRQHTAWRHRIYVAMCTFLLLLPVAFTMTVFCMLWDHIHGPKNAPLSSEKPEEPHTLLAQQVNGATALCMPDSLTQELLARFAQTLLNTQENIALTELCAACSCICNRAAAENTDIPSLLLRRSDIDFLVQPTQTALRAARDALLGFDPSAGATDFTIGQEIPQNAVLTAVYADFSFFRILPDAAEAPADEKNP